MKSVEATGKNVQEARRIAAEMLGVSEEQVEFEVISKPGTLAGLFGGGECRVRATLIEDEQIADTSDTEQQQPPDDDESGDVSQRRNVWDADDEIVERVGQRAVEVVEHIVTEIGVENAHVVTERTDDGEITLNIEGDNLGLIIGRRGETLDALQLIVAIAANRSLEDGARIILDAEDYRRRHRDTLHEMALEYAADAKKRGQEVVIPDLKAYERRIVHMALRDDPEVETYSEGEGRDRILVISPVDR